MNNQLMVCPSFSTVCITGLVSAFVCVMVSGWRRQVETSENIFLFPCDCISWHHGIVTVFINSYQEKAKATCDCINKKPTNKFWNKPVPLDYFCRSVWILLSARCLWKPLLLGWNKSVTSQPVPDRCRLQTQATLQHYKWHSLTNQHGDAYEISRLQCKIIFSDVAHNTRFFFFNPRNMK